MVAMGSFARCSKTEIVSENATRTVISGVNQKGKLPRKLPSEARRTGMIEASAVDYHMPRS